MTLTCDFDQTSPFGALYVANAAFNVSPDRLAFKVMTVHGKYCTPFGLVRFFKPSGADPADLSNDKAVILILMVPRNYYL